MMAVVLDVRYGCRQSHSVPSPRTPVEFSPLWLQTPRALHSPLQRELVVDR